MLHFRSFLITGLMVGAALLLPHNAFAEKNNPSEKSIPEKAAVQARAAVVQKAEVQAQASAASQKTVHQPAVKPVIKAAPLQAGSKKTVAKAQSEAAIANGRTGQILAKQQKAVIPPGLNKAAAAIVKKKAEQQAAPEKSPLTVKPVQDVEIETKVQPEKPIHRDFHQVKKTSIKVSRVEHTVPEPTNKETPPASQEELPKISPMLNQVQRTGGSGGDSNDRVTHGSSSIYGMDKWLEWDSYRESQLVQLFVSRHTFIQNQWMNAPPSPPPKESSFFKNVTR